MKIKCSYTELVPLKKLVPHDKNRNKHPKDQIERLAKIIDFQGQRHPIIVSKRSGKIVAGHGRFAALKKLKWDKAAVDYQDFKTEEEEYAFLVSDNAIALWAELELDNIKLDLEDLKPLDLDLLGLKDLSLGDIEVVGKCDEDEVPEVKHSVVKRGDIWLLGNHRVMCGDSTMIDDVEKLMKGEKADFWITDPPYGVAYESNGNKDKHEKILNDALPMEKMKELWFKCASNAFIVTSNECAYYWFACQGGDQMMMMMMMIGDAGWKLRHELIWNKDSMVLGRCDYHYKHEPIFYGWKIKGKHNWYSDRKQVSVIDMPRPKKSEEHPTMKPVELIEYLMKNSSKPGDIVLDTFGGSGTTLIAAEKTQRKAMLIELYEKYCDVIINRWQKYTGKEAILEGSGKKYNDLVKKAKK